jgi:hypothetical protein
MRIVAFITEYAVVDRIIDHLKLTFAAAKLQCYVERSNRTHREEFYEVEDIAIRLDEHNQHPPSIACPAHPK